MKKLLLFSLLLFTTGCASVSIPNYIKDEHPYTQTFYAPYEQVHQAVTTALNDAGWAVEAESDPALFEVGFTADDGEPQTVIFTKIRQLSFFVGSRYARLNVFLHVNSEKATEVEVRYMNVSQLQVKTLYDYRNDALVQHLLDDIEERLNNS